MAEPIVVCNQRQVSIPPPSGGGWPKRLQRASSRATRLAVAFGFI